MREWLSGGASPCQGEGRGFDPRLALQSNTKKDIQMDILFCVKKYWEKLNVNLNRSIIVCNECYKRKYRGIKQNEF